MPKTNVLMSLAKVMIAAAWTDGSINNDEINCLKDLLFQLPEMTASDWAELDIYIESPVGEAERARLLEDLKSALRTSGDKDLVLEMIEHMMGADGQVTSGEQAAMAEIKETIQDANAGLFGQFGKLLQGPMDRRSKAFMSAPNRELYIEDYKKNKIFYSVCRRLDLDESEIDIPEKDLRKLSLAGGLMARVAYVDREVHEGEFNSMVNAIQDHWKIAKFEATLVAEVAVSEVRKGLDDYRVSRRFFELTDEEERLRFLDVLFAVADGDGRVSYEETEEIRAITNVLKLTHKQFIDAKLKILSERRAN